MVVPCYNKVSYIERMLDSVIGQKWDNIEVILVNDGSTDGTREIIAEYDPKLRERGYEVVILDQENKGVAPAVDNGLKIMNGEYVCMPDCDDILHEEYVSAMAEYLDQNPDIDWVACDSSYSPFDKESVKGLKRSYFSKYEHYPYLLFESFLLQRVRVEVWHRMCRVQFVLSSLDSNKLNADLRSTQEPYINMLLSSRSKKIACIHRDLYYYDLDNTNLNKFISFQSIKKVFDTEKAAHLDVLLKDNQPQITIALIELSYFVLCIRMTKKYPEATEYVKEQFELFKETILNSSILSPEILNGIVLTLDNINIFWRGFTNVIIGNKPIINTIKQNSNGRIIAYAALTQKAKYELLCILNSDIRPNLLWDAAAKDNSEVNGIKVTKPDIGSLTEKDTVLVFLQDKNIAMSLSDELEATKAKGNIYYYYDILDYVSQLMFPTVNENTINYSREKE